MSIEDLMKRPSEEKEVEILQSEIALFKMLINERSGPFDLLRELLSNACAKEVEASRISVKYTIDEEGHVFEVKDNGCGMNYTGNNNLPGRLDRFLGLGLSEIVGIKSDEFGFKGLGSKLAYQSRNVEIETKFKDHPCYIVRINEPWSTLDGNRKPKPRIAKFEDQNLPMGTRIKVVGHPPHHKGDVLTEHTFEEIIDYLMHRTFIGFTKERDNPPSAGLTVLGKSTDLKFGYPELRSLEAKLQGKILFLDENEKTLFVNLSTKPSSNLKVRLKGFLTWNKNIGLSDLAKGLIFSSKGIPYFRLDLEEYGARGIATANPGYDYTCLVIDCDNIHNDMNIARSHLLDNSRVTEFKKIATELFNQLESSTEYLGFRNVPKEVRIRDSADHISKEKTKIESSDQNWVVLERPGQEPKILIREPKCENEVNAILWKLEAYEALPFKEFKSLGYIGGKKGPDLLVHFQEDNKSEADRYIVVEIENNFYSYKSHGHSPSQYPRVICWDAPSSGRKDRLTPDASKKYKFTIEKEGYQVHVYVLKLLDNIKVYRRDELAKKGLRL